MEILHIIWTVISVISVIFTAIFVYFFIINVYKELTTREKVEDIKKTMKIVYVEQVDNMWHMHDKFGHHFICQAATEQELLDKAKQMYPDMKIITTTKEFTVERIK
jgi:heme/copper-type cytochrome/quinol oxidase subunit 2